MVLLSSYNPQIPKAFLDGIYNITNMENNITEVSKFFY